MKKKIAIPAAVLIALAVIFYFAFPGPIYQAAIYAGRSSAGLSEKTVQVDDHRIVYLEGGKGQTVLLVHGYGAEKDNWVMFAKHLTPMYRVVIPDLAGFGDSSRLPDAAYDIGSQTARLDRFAETVKLDRFHIAGNSMGGQIAGTYAAEYPGKVLSLGLLAPAGIKSPEKSELVKSLEKGTNPLLIDSSADYDRMLGMLFVKIPYMPYPVKRTYMEKAVKYRGFNEKIMRDMMRRPLGLEPFLPRIETPTLILWGDQDRLLHVSGVKVLEKDIRNHQTVIMKDCGHIPMVERPAETAGYYLKFLSSASD